jgi:hypothetical protein
MSTSDERAVAQLVADLLAPTATSPVATFNDGTRIYAWSAPDGIYVSGPLGSHHFELQVVAPGPTGDDPPETANYYEVAPDGAPSILRASTFLRGLDGHWTTSFDNIYDPAAEANPSIPDGFEFFVVTPLLSGINQVAIAGDDDDLELPAAVVTATFEEEARALKKNGNYGGRYRVDIELRGIRTKPGTASLDTILSEIEQAMNTVPDPLPASAAAFSYFFIDARLGAQNITDEETRELVRSYSIFALLA